MSDNSEKLNKFLKFKAMFEKDMHIIEDFKKSVSELHSSTDPKINQYINECKDNIMVLIAQLGYIYAWYS